MGYLMSVVVLTTNNSGAQVSKILKYKYCFSRYSTLLRVEYDIIGSYSTILQVKNEKFILHSRMLVEYDFLIFYL